MPKYKCSKCGETAYSKNVRTRNIFCSDQIAAIMLNIANVITTRKDNGRRKVVLEFPYTDTNPDWTDDELEIQVVKNIKGLTDEQILHWLCDHRWELIEGSGEEL